MDYIKRGGYINGSFRDRMQKETIVKLLILDGLTDSQICDMNASQRLTYVYLLITV